MQNPKTTQEIIDEQVKKLPKEVRDAIVSVDYNTKLEEIYKRQKLLIDQSAKLEMETSLVMIGLEPITLYTENLQRELNLPIMRVKEIAMDVNEHIFKPIRDSLQKMSEGLFEEENTNENKGTEPGVKSTTAEDIDLDRDQILNEIENPATIDKGDRTMAFTQSNPPHANPIKTTELEIRPEQEIEIIPGEEAKDVKAEVKKEEKPVQKNIDVVQSKMSGPTVTSQQIIDVKPEIKLPEIEKKRPTSGIDPYREPLI
jgi:hypothetical protein